LVLPSRLKQPVALCGGNNDIAIHIRIDKDWNYDSKRVTPYCVMKEKQLGVFYCYTPKDILQNIKNSEVMLDGVLDGGLKGQGFTLLFGEPYREYVLGSGSHPYEVGTEVFEDVSFFHKSSSESCLNSLRYLSYNEQAYVDLCPCFLISPTVNQVF